MVVKTEHKIVVISVTLGLLFWVVDAFVDGLFFLDQSFWEMLVLDVPPYEIYIRSLGMGFFLVSGLFVSRSLAKRRRAEEALRESEVKYHSLMKDASDAIVLSDLQGRVLEANQRVTEITGFPARELLNRHLTEFLSKEEHQRAVAAFKETIVKGSVSLSDVAALRTDGNTVPIDITGSLVEYLNKKVVQWIFRDITARKRAEEEQALLRRRLEALWGIARLTEASHQELCDNVLAEITDMTDSPYAFYGFLNEDEDVMTLYSWSKDALQSCQVLDKPLHFPIAKAGLWANAVRERRTLIINDYDEDHPNKQGLPEGHVPLTRIMVVPVFSYGRIVALVAVANRPTVYVEECARQIEAFATNVQIIIESQRAREALQRSEKELRLLSSQLLTAQEDERRWIAYELHEELGQSMASIKLRLETLIKQATSKTDIVGIELLQDLVSVVQKSIEEVRNVSMALRPTTLDSLGIISTITWFCREFQKTYPEIRIEKEIDIQEDEVAEPLKVAIYRIIQETLHNVGKHSGADTARICLQKTDGIIELAVEDNGSGFDIEEALSVETSKRGFGLGSMKERTELSGGTFVIDSVKARGTIVRASWPTQ